MEEVSRPFSRSPLLQKSSSAGPIGLLQTGWGPLTPQICSCTTSVLGSASGSGWSAPGYRTAACGTRSSSPGRPGARRCRTTCRGGPPWWGKGPARGNPALQEKTGGLRSTEHRGGPTCVPQATLQNTTLKHAQNELPPVAKVLALCCTLHSRLILKDQKAMMSECFTGRSYNTFFA